MSNDKIIHDILLSGFDDWVPLGEITCQLGPGLSDEEILAATVEIVRPVLESGWMQIGDLSPEFVARGWSAARSLDWIRQEWHRLGPGAERQYMCWFANTPLGDEKARSFGAT